MTEKKPVLTQEIFDELNQRLRYLLDVEDPEIKEKLNLARSQGDLSENADYSAARDRQAQIDSEIRMLESVLHSAIIVDESASNDQVSIGHTVTFVKLPSNEAKVVRLVGNIGADPTSNPPAVSNESPIGKALIDKKVGEIATVESPRGNYSVKIVSINM